MTKISRLLLVVLLSLFMGASAYAAGNDSNTVLLINGEETSTWSNGATFTESSVGGNGGSQHTVTISGQTTSATGQTGFGNAISFDGSGDYLTIPDNDDWNFGSGDFTIDFWVKFNSNDHYMDIMGHRTDGVNYMRLARNLNNFLGVVIVESDSALVEIYDSEQTIPNTWYHVVFVRNGDSFILYKNGINVGSDSYDSNLPNFTSSFLFGSYSGYDYYLNGYMDEIRISKGIARTQDPNDPMYLIIDSDEDGINDRFPVPTVPYDENPLITSLTTTPDPASGDVPLTVNFEVTPAGGASPYTYSWDFDNDGVEDSTAQNPSYTYTSAGSYTATVTVTDDNGNTATGSIDISVDQPLSIDSYSATPSTGTAPVIVEFSVTATGGTAPYTYAWDFDNDGIEDSTDQNPEYTYTSAYSGNANITVTDADENIVSQNISINISELTTEDCYASYNFLSDKFHVSCFAIEGEVYRFDMTINDVEIDESSIVKIK